MSAIVDRPTTSTTTTTGTSTPSNKKRVYSFHEGGKEDKALLGGKGSNLCEMTKIGLPVPPGFTITTETCLDFFANGEAFPIGLM